jgi:hypothetical protein
VLVVVLVLVLLLVVGPAERAGLEEWEPHAATPPMTPSSVAANHALPLAGKGRVSIGGRE